MEDTLNIGADRLVQQQVDICRDTVSRLPAHMADEDQPDGNHEELHIDIDQGGDQVR